MVTFLFSGPRHHVEIMVPVARELARRNVRTRFVSLAELRGLATPSPATFPSEVRRVLPRLRASPTTGTSAAGTSDSIRRRALRELMWRSVLAPRLRWLLRDSDVVVVPNDAAFPYDRVAASLRRRGTPFVLVQEGVRYVTPGERAGAIDAYGAGGASAICVWGEAFASHFQAIGVTAERIAITGNPRFDEVDPAAWRPAADALLQRLGLSRRPLLFLSSAIDDLGFCTTDEKLAIFRRFLRAAVPVLAARQRGVLVKLHPREDPRGFAAVIAECGNPHVHLIRDDHLFAVLAAGAAAVILPSTVGLEALVFGLPLAVLAIPGHGHVFDYVAAGAAVGLDDGDLAEATSALLAQPLESGRPEVVAFVTRHMAHRGRAAANVAERVVALTGRRP
jgi:hypothetical protein